MAIYAAKHVETFGANQYQTPTQITRCLPNQRTNAAADSEQSHPADTDAALSLELLCSPLQTRSVVGHRPIEPDLPERLTDLVLNGLKERR
ncbi:hypothetical protein GCM10010207_84500 [Streptomyces atratus]|nr:hypothetical protein GCM10010207_84500 [Streptomyces atratus]